MGVFLPDHEIFGGKLSFKESGFVEKVAQEQANLVLADFRSGMDQYKTNERMKHRLDKVARRSRKKTLGRIKKRMAEIIRESPEFRVVTGKGAREAMSSNLRD